MRNSKVLKILYIFPHPDDESFGPAPGIYQQLKNGHEVYLLTLTEGGATKVRHELGLTVPEMGSMRKQEMECVKETLGLSGMTILNLPDSGLKYMNPIEIETVIKKHIKSIKPDIIVTYTVHGNSGFHDHLVTHAVVKRVFCELKETTEHAPKRLALYTLGPNFNKGNSPFNMQTSPIEDIDCILNISEDEAIAGKAALKCYKTYENVIKKTGIAEMTGDDICFEFFGEKFDPPLNDLTLALE